MSRLSARDVALSGRPRISTPRVWLKLLPTILLLTLIFTILAIGWSYRGNALLTPREGLGYALGIVGGSMLLLVLLYPLRKRLKFMRSWSKLAHWFRWHMVFGCLGPTLIVVHAQFDARSANGFMALASMLVVAASGIVGRYLYGRIHRGLYGAKLEARELLSGAIALRPAIGGPFNWEEPLKAFENAALSPPASLLSGIRKAALLSLGTRRAECAIRRAIRRRLTLTDHPVERAAQRATEADIRGRLRRYFKTLRRTGSLAVYERLFALWHVLHLPLIFLLVLTAIIHVIAVHLY
jgi:hypothetical protein